MLVIGSHNSLDQGYFAQTLSTLSVEVLLKYHSGRQHRSQDPRALATHCESLCREIATFFSRWKDSSEGRLHTRLNRLLAWAPYDS